MNNKTLEIAKAIIRDTDRLRRMKAGKATAFDKRAEAAIARASTRFLVKELPDDKARERVRERVMFSLITGTPWEHCGETYVGRRLFYTYRNRYVEIVAEEMGLTRRHRGNG